MLSSSCPTNHLYFPLFWFFLFLDHVHSFLVRDSLMSKFRSKFVSSIGTFLFYDLFDSKLIKAENNETRQLSPPLFFLYLFSSFEFQFVSQITPKVHMRINSLSNIRSIITNLCIVLSLHCWLLQFQSFKNEEPEPGSRNHAEPSGQESPSGFSTLGCLPVESYGHYFYWILTFCWQFADKIKHFKLE